MSDNYPDDIRRYDSDPHSPFYDEPCEDEDEAEAAEERKLDAAIRASEMRAEMEAEKNGY